MTDNPLPAVVFVRHPPSNDSDKRLYRFRRQTPEGVSVLAGADLWAPSPHEAMHQLQWMWGRTAKEGWYAEDVTDDAEFRRHVKR